MPSAGVGFDGTRFRVRVPFAMNTRAKMAPDRTWDKENKIWILPNNGPNRRYLNRNFAREEISDKAYAVLVEEPEEENLGAWPHDWTFPVEPMKHQVECLRALWPHRTGAIFHEMGLGKTFTAIQMAAARHVYQGVEAVAVVCPTSIKDVWAREFADYCNLATVHVHRSGQHGLTQKFISDSTIPFPVLVVGVESLSIGAKWVKNGRETHISHSRAGRLLEEFVHGRECMMVIDESLDIKNAKSLRTGAAWDIGTHSDFRLIMTGTDISQGIEDLYAQFRFLDWEIIGQKSFYGFKKRYCVEEHIPGQRPHVTRIVGYDNVAELMGYIAPYVHQRKKDQCLDLPDKVYETRIVTASPDQKRAFRELKKKYKTEFEGKKIEVKSILEAYVRFQQIAGGFMPHLVGEKNGKPLYEMHPFPKNPKLEELLNLLDKIPSKAIIWANYVPEIEIIGQAIATKYGDRSMGLFYGATPEDDRRVLSQIFQDPNDEMRFMVSNPAVGGMGQTWTAATTVIYYSSSFSYYRRVQSEDRPHRKGQTNKVTYIDLLCDLPIDRHVVSIVQNKKDLADYADELMAEIMK